MTPEGGSQVSQEAINQYRRLVGISNFNRMDRLGEERKLHPQLALSHAEGMAEHFKGTTNLLVIPYAAMDEMRKAADEIEALQRVLSGVKGINIHSIHEESGEGILKAAEQADAYFLGPGNTYLLADRLHREGLVEVIRQGAANEKVVSGASAGPLMMADTITGAADPTVPVVEENGKRVIRVDGLGLLPSNVHPVVHYIDFDELFDKEEQEVLHRAVERFGVLFDHLHSVPSNIGWHLRYFPNDTVYAMPDDTYFVARGMEFTHHGEKAGIIFQAGKERQVVEPGASLNPYFFPQAA